MRFSPVAVLSLFISAAAGLSFDDYTSVFAFGDSYTATPTDLNHAQPTWTFANDTAGSTSGGLNWLQYMREYDTTKSYYNFARISATTTNAIVNTYVPSTQDQIGSFEQNFVVAGQPKLWKPATSLFAIWSGINDIGYSYLHGQHFPTIADGVAAAYEANIARLYAAGARHFLLPNAPPTELAPLVQTYSAETIAFFKSNTDLWNGKLALFVAALPTKFPGASVTLFDAYGMYMKVLASPSVYGIKDTKAICIDYIYVHYDPFFSSPSCAYSVGEYFWHSSYHVSWTVNKVMGDEVIKALSMSAPSRGVKKGKAPSRLRARQIR